MAEQAAMQDKSKVCQGPKLTAETGGPISELAAMWDLVRHLYQGVK